MNPSENWRRVSKENPCAICGKDHACKVSVDGAVALCLRVERGAFKHSNGWHFHRLKEGGNCGFRIAEREDCGFRIADCGLSGQAAGNPQVATGEPQSEIPNPKSDISNPQSEIRNPKSLDSAIASAAASCGGSFHRGWVYRNLDGSEFAHVVRFALPNAEKAYRPIHQRKGVYKIGDPPGLWPLYRLNEIAHKEIVFVAEGEKCADVLFDHMFPATTSAHGAASASKTDWSPLAGKKVIIFPDNDEPGRKYAREVARILMQLDRPAQVKIIELPKLPPGGDVADFYDAGGDFNTLVDLDTKFPWLNRADIFGGPLLVSMDQVQPAEVRWLWPGRMALGRITLLVGRPGEGKSFLTTDMAARVTTGTPWPDGSACPEGSVILICAEDDPSDTIRPRLDAHCADASRVRLLSAVRRVDDSGKHRELMFSLDDVASLETALRQTGDCRLIVVDPIGSFLGNGTDAHRDNEVRSLLSPIGHLAEKYNAAVLVVAHRRKGGATNADDLAMGSRAFTGIARAVWHLSRDPVNKSRRLLLPGKNNLGPEGKGLAFSINGEPPCVVWEREAIDMTADEALEGDQDPASAGMGRSETADWLAQQLADGQEHPVATLREQASGAGISWRTLQRAALKLAVQVRRAGFGGGCTWAMASGEQGGPSTQGAALVTTT